MYEVTDLNGKWELHPVSEFSNLWISPDAPKEGWTRQEIPAHWQQESAFHDYSGKMVYRKSFSFKPEENRIYRLRLNGVFYRYRAYLNNFILGGSSGYFYPTFFDLTRYIKSENLLLLEVDSPHREEEKGIMTGVFSNFPDLPERYNPGGIWRPVEILSSGPAYIDDWNLQTMNLGNDWGEMLLQIRIFSAEAEEAVLRVILTPDNFQGDPLELKISLPLIKGMNSFEERFKASNIKPWWSWDLGDPNLYRVDLSLENNGEVWDRRSERTGIRTFKMKEFVPYLNGERFIAKGSNYLPGDIYPARLSKELIEQDLALVKKSHQNMLRCYQHIEPSQFYQATDEAGILVWQDFPYCSDSSAELFAEASTQLFEMVRMLKNRSSVVVWTVNNLNSFGERTSLPGRVVTAERLGRRLVEMDPTRPVVSASGDRKFYSSHDTGFGCGVIPGEGRLYEFDRYRSGVRGRQIRFVSWFGAPDLAREQGDLKDYADLLPQNIMLDKKGRAGTDSLKNSQGDILRFYIDRLRYHKYRPTGGMLFYCLKEFLKGFRWAVVDNTGRPKEGFEKISLCYRPIYVFALFDKGAYKCGELLQFPICFGNDRHGSTQTTTEVKARLSDPDNQLVWKDQWQVDSTPDEETRTLRRVSVLLMKKGVYTLEIFWEDGETVENVYRIPVN